MTSAEITHHRIWHSSAATIVAKTLALALLPVFDLVRPHDLTHYHEDGFPKVVGRPCGYSSLAHFVGDLIAIEVYEEWQAALARRYLELWYDDPTDPDRIKSFFDWDMTTVGDPLIDLGTLLNYWTDYDDKYDRTRRPNHDAGKMPRRIELVERYAELTGIEVEKAKWYEAFALWKTAVVVQQIYIRYARGQTNDERFAAMNQDVPILVELASDALKEVGV